MKSRLLPEDDPVLAALGFTDAQGRIKPTRQAKYRQVDEFLRDLAPVVDDAVAAGPGADADADPTRCGWSTWAAATPTSPSRRTATSATCGGCRSTPPAST